MLEESIINRRFDIIKLYSSHIEQMDRWKYEKVNFKNNSLLMFYVILIVVAAVACCLTIISKLNIEHNLKRIIICNI